MIRTIAIAALAAALPAAALADSMSGMMGHDGTLFTVTIENVSTSTTLRSMKGETAPAPNSPGVWVVERKPARLFKTGKVEMGWGLERQAEDGDPSMLAAHCGAHEGVSASGVFDTPVGDDKAGPALPGKSYRFTFMARPGDRLAFTTMFGQSNDVFFAPDENGIALFEKGHPVSGDVTAKIMLWDAGTEVNEEPGFGPNQAPRQAAANTGPSERRAVGKVKDGFLYPAVAQVLKVTITPAQSLSGN
jgi:hypothetical protein